MGRTAAGAVFLLKHFDCRMFGRKVVFMGISAMATVKVAANSLKNNKGASLMYVLITLVFVGAIAMLVLNSSRKETIDSSLRASTEMARFAATSGLNMATTRLADPARDAEISTKLQAWFTAWQSGATIAENAPERWIVGSAAGANQFVTDPANPGMRFRVQIVNADFSDIRNDTRITRRVTDDGNTFRFPDATGVARDLTIAERAMVRGTAPNRYLQVAHPENSKITLSLKSESIDRSGSRATNLGFYTVLGFERPEIAPALNIPTHAFFLGGGNMWIHCPVTINGRTYIGNRGNTGTALFLTGATGATIRSHFNGEFRMYQSDGVEASNLANATFTGPAYFEGGNLWFVDNSEIIFQQGFGGSTMFFRHGGGAVSAPSGSVVLASGYQRLLTYAITLGANTRLHYVNSGNYFNVAPGGYTSLPARQEITNRTAMDNFPGNAISGGTIANFQSHPSISPAQAKTYLFGSALEEPQGFSIDLSQIPENRIYNLPNPGAHPYLGWDSDPITGNHLQNWFDNPGQGGRPHLHIDRADKPWLVIRTSSAASTRFGNGTVNFTGRAVIIVTGTTSGDAAAGTGFPSVNTDPNQGQEGIILYYKQPSTNRDQQINHPGINGTFRGMFFNGCSRTMINLSAAAAGWTANGAFYNAPGATGSVIQFGAGAAGPITVNYNQAVICEIANLGVFGENVSCEPDDGDGGGGAIQLQRVPGETVRASLLNRSF